ncbi:hypothetical protein M3182_17380 [Mesobacillus maritimus]|uniref:hypothetical protein n=1 Tax=Mesobacillus maritimus TaxID=1643336 RepID=UPI00203EB93A|nr:hypothetical protein [Mesobacillus maritimus]MCM3587511.1 hypothetical protein [Mesobacillus maritimus]MCM3671157.1 hypothetical protein [Mesobacillus maritimus]
MHLVKQGIMAFCLIMIVGNMAGCSNTAGSNDTDQRISILETTNVEDQELVVGKYPFPSQQKSKGTGKLTVITPAGSSANDTTPVFYVDNDDRHVQIAINADHFDGSKQTFVYVDQLYLKPEQFVTRTKTSIDLQDKLIRPGTHTISFIQFEDDNPYKGKVTNFSEVDYRVAKKK